MVIEFRDDVFGKTISTFVNVDYDGIFKKIDKDSLLEFTGHAGKWVVSDIIYRFGPNPTPEKITFLVVPYNVADYNENT